MENRIFTQNQIHIYVLVMNNVHDRCEGADVVATSTDYDYLVNWYKEQYANEPYRDDDGYYKVFKKGSELEYYNPIYDTELNHCNHWGHGIKDMWIDEYRLSELRGYYNLIYEG